MKYFVVLTGEPLRGEEVHDRLKRIGRQKAPSQQTILTSAGSSWKENRDATIIKGTNLEILLCILGHQQMYDLERFYGTKVSFYKGTDSYKSYKLVQTPNFSVRLMPYTWHKSSTEQVGAGLGY